MSKYSEIAELVKRRIRKEDYTVNRFPGIRKLAEDCGVSYLTARQAMLKLVDDGVLLQKENGYFSINPQWNRDKAEFKVAFLTHHQALPLLCLGKCGDDGGGKLRGLLPAGLLYAR